MEIEYSDIGSIGSKYLDNFFDKRYELEFENGARRNYGASDLIERCGQVSGFPLISRDFKSYKDSVVS